MIKIFKFGAIFFFIALVFIYFQNPKFTPKTFSNLPKFQVGDLVFRKGIGSDSEVIAKITDFKYTHIGFVAEISPEILIIHATTTDFLDKQNQVVLSTLDEFLNHSLKFGALRLNLSQNEAKMIANLLKTRLGSEFKFAPKGEPNLYCTTFLESEISKFLKFELKYENLNIPMIGGEYLLPRAFWEINGATILYESE